MGINIVFKDIEKQLEDILKQAFNSIVETTRINDNNFSWTIHVYPLSEKKRVHEKRMTGDYQGDNSYRALTFPNKNETFIYLNNGEDINSLCWVFAHELTHINITQNNFINMICKNNYYVTLEQQKMNSKKYQENIKNDSFHDSLLEEQIANTLATELIGKDYGRLWWREQLLLKAV